MPCRLPRKRSPERPRHVEDADRDSDDPAVPVAEEVAVDIVDRVVLDHDHAGQFELDDALPDQEPGERDDERRNADQRHERPLEGADGRRARECDQDAEPPGEARPDRSGLLEQRGDHARHSTDVADRQVDLPDQQHEDDAVGDQAGARHLPDQIREVDRRGEVVDPEVEKDNDDQEREDDGRASDVPRADVGAEALRVALTLGHNGARRHAAPAPAPPPAVGGAGTSALTGSVEPTPWSLARVRFRRMPETLVGFVPAVIACTTSCCVVSLRS